MRIVFIFLLFALSSCQGDKGVQKSYIISESPAMDTPVETPKVNGPICQPY